MKTKTLKWLSAAWVHVLGVTIVSLLLMLPFVDRVTLQGYAVAMEHPEFRGFTGVDTAIFMGLVICAWALLVITYRLVQLRRKERKLRVLKTSRGTAITETLIVLPVWLLITMGLMQLCTISIAGILTNLATFQAARTAWVWSGELQEGRRGVSYGTIMSKARVQAAYALAPVAPGDYFHNPFFVSDDFKAARASVIAAQLAPFGTDTGRIGYAAAYAVELEDLKGMVSMGTAADMTLARSLDLTSFRTRSVRKFTWAYNATTVIPFATLGRAGAVVVYAHQISVPLIPWAFGQRMVISGRIGYYRPIFREFNFQGSLAANPRMP